MPRRLRNFNGLKKPKIRQDWSKENLYNLSRLFNPTISNSRRTFFQQKWYAKAAARGYHNPYVREGLWTRTFDRRLPSVVPMDYKYLAANDGSEQAAGRGRGADTPPSADGRPKIAPAKTPYMHMTFHPLERRLDTAIWRALFASSAQQARQFVVHGAVKVNGRKMQHPGYMLNPGDMFSVDPERVMYATGAMKFNKDDAGSREDQPDKKSLAKEEEEAAEAEEAEAVAEASGEGAEAQELESTLPEEQTNDPKKALKNLVFRAQRILDDSKRKLSGKRQQELRDFTRSVRTTMSKLRGVEESAVPETVGSLETGLAEILTKIPRDDLPKDEGAAVGEAQAALEAEDPDIVAERDAKLLHAALERARANPMDPSKPYATPWKPRAYMSAFAFIPRYLEVNQKICSAVYLRHPVARPGLAEAPTPFHHETMELAFNWYLRRR